MSPRERIYCTRREKLEEDLFYHWEKLIEALNNNILRHADLRRGAVASRWHYKAIRRASRRSTFLFPFLSLLREIKNDHNLVSRLNARIHNISLTMQIFLYIHVVIFQNLIELSFICAREWLVTWGVPLIDFTIPWRARRFITELLLRT